MHRAVAPGTATFTWLDLIIGFRNHGFDFLISSQQPGSPGTSKPCRDKAAVMQESATLKAGPPLEAANWLRFIQLLNRNMTGIPRASILLS